MVALYPQEEQQEDEQEQDRQRQEAHTGEYLVYRLHSVSQIAHHEGEDHQETCELIKTVCSLRSPTT